MMLVITLIRVVDSEWLIEGFLNSAAFLVIAFDLVFLTEALVTFSCNHFFRIYFRLEPCYNLLSGIGDVLFSLTVFYLIFFV